jgi:hypothetical protein
MKKKIDPELRDTLTSLAETLDKSGDKPLSAVKKRIVKARVQMVLTEQDISSAAFQHSILCQAFLPYKDPGDEVRLWDHRQGNARLLLKAGELLNPRTDEWEQIGLPYGAKARLILAYVNTQAIKAQSPVVDVEESLSAFITKLGLHREGKTIGMIKEQLRRLAASNINMAFTVSDEQVVQTKFDIIKAFDLWFPRDERQRVLWTSQIQLSEDYFNSLSQHAVPLNIEALTALAHSAMAIDIYSWLAQRLHRIEGSQFVGWANLKEQFGQAYTRMDNFKRDFRSSLRLVKTVYKEARIEEIENKGFTLLNSPSQISKTIYQMPGLGTE